MILRPPISTRPDTRFPYSPRFRSLFYEQLAPVWALARATTLPFLRCAAQLHETGLAISHNSYQKHSEYIVQHSDLQAFSQTDTVILGALLRLHRGKFAATSTAGLPDEWREPVRRTATTLQT